MKRKCCIFMRRLGRLDLHGGQVAFVSVSISGRSVELEMNTRLGREIVAFFRRISRGVQHGTDVHRVVFSLRSLSIFGRNTPWVHCMIRIKISDRLHCVDEHLNGLGGSPKGEKAFAKPTDGSEPFRK